MIKHSIKNNKQLFKNCKYGKKLSKQQNYYTYCFLYFIQILESEKTNTR